MFHQQFTFVHFGDFRNVGNVLCIVGIFVKILEILKKSKTKIPRMECAFWGFWVYSGSFGTPATLQLLTCLGSPGTQGTTGVYPHEFDPWEYPRDPRDPGGANIPVFPGDTMAHRHHPPQQKFFLHKKMFTFYNQKTPYCCNPCVGAVVFATNYGTMATVLFLL